MPVHTFLAGVVCWADGVPHTRARLGEPLTGSNTALEEVRQPLDARPPRAGAERPDLLGTLSNGLAVLNLFDRDHREWSLDELSERTGIRRVNVHRLAKTLAHSGYLVNEPSTGKYLLGPAMLRARYLIEDYSELVFQAHPHAEKLAQETGETVALVVYIAGVPIIIDMIQTARPFLATVELGYTPGDTASSAAKLFAAFRPEREQQKILSQPLQQWTPKTDVDPEATAREFETIRKEGLSVDIEQRFLGTSCASAPVYNQLEHLVAALSLIVPAGRFGPEERKIHLPALKAAADSLSRYLGFSGQAG